MIAPDRREIADALRLGAAWTAKFIANRSVEGEDDYVVRNAEADLRKIQSVKSRFNLRDDQVRA